MSGKKAVTEGVKGIKAASKRLKTMKANRAANKNFEYKGKRGKAAFDAWGKDFGITAEKLGVWKKAKAEQMVKDAYSAPFKGATKKRKVESTRPVIKAKATPPSKPTPVKDAALAFTAGAGTAVAIDTALKNRKKKQSKKAGGRVKNRNMGGVIGGGLGSQDVVDYLYKYKS
tara:strand:+ start:52 stop:567 length:516 start_codon:yes stop_codon:yes gene_type:complete